MVEAAEMLVSGEFEERNDLNLDAISKCPGYIYMRQGS